MKKKQMLAALMGVAMLSTLLAGCGGGDKEGSSEGGGVKEYSYYFRFELSIPDFIFIRYKVMNFSVLIKTFAHFFILQLTEHLFGGII